MLKVTPDDTTNVDINKSRDAHRVAESVAFSQQLSSGVWVVPIVHLGKTCGIGLRWVMLLNE